MQIEYNQAQKKHEVIEIIEKIITNILLRNINVGKNPYLGKLKGFSEDLEQVPNSEILKRWVNYHLGEAEKPLISNFTSDL